jgi:hypothetical protein
VEQALQAAFIDTYQLVMWLCAGLAALSALAAFILIRGELVESA